jgi:hypothetical protein
MLNDEWSGIRSPAFRIHRSSFAGSLVKINPARPARTRLALATALALTLAACGGDSSPPPPDNPVPSLTSISPTSAEAGGDAFTLTANGSNFISGSEIRWDGASRATAFVSDTQLTAAIPASDIAASGTVQVTVFNPSPGGGTSSGQMFSIDNPVPTLSLLSPNSVLAGSAAFTLTATGSNFVSTSVVQWDGSPRTTTFVSGNQLQASIPASDVASIGTAQITVFNPTPGGGTSGSRTFTVSAIVPLAFSTTRLPDTTGGKDYDFLLSASGGVTNPSPNDPPYSDWAVVSGSLPAGLFLDSTTGQILGTVTGSTQTFTVQVTDFAATPNTATRDLTIRVLPSPIGRNDFCTSGSTAGTTQISNGTIRSSLSPYGDVDVYSFQGTAGNQVTIETFAQRLDLDGDSATRDSQADTILELLDSSCTQITFNDDIVMGDLQDSLIQDFALPSSSGGLYFISVQDFRGDGRPDLLYDLSLTGAD